MAADLHIPKQLILVDHAVEEVNQLDLVLLGHAALIEVDVPKNAIKFKFTFYFLEYLPSSF